MKKTDAPKITLPAIKMEPSVHDNKNAVVKTAQALKVVDQPTYHKAAALLVHIKQYQKTVEATFKPIKQAIDAAKKSVLDQEKVYLVPAQEAEALIKGKMGTFELEEEKKHEAAQQDADDAARKERERLAALAAKAEARGDDRKADQYRAMADTVMTTAVDAAVDKVAGIGSRDDVEVEVVDARAFCDYVVRNTSAPLDPIVTFKVGGIKAFIKYHGLTECAGLRITRKKVISAGGGL